MVKHKKSLVKLAGVLITMRMLMSCAMVSFSAASVVKVNDMEAAAGDVVTYTVKMVCPDKLVAGLDMTIAYDSESLELMKDTVNTPYLQSVVCNSNTAGEIVFNAIEAIKGIDIKSEQVIISASFKVKEGAVDCKVTNSMSEIIDLDLNNLTTDDYVITEAVQEGTLPQDEVVNPGDGYDQIASDDTASSLPQNGGGMSTQTYIILALVGVVILLVILAVIFKIKSNKKKDNTEE